MTSLGADAVAEQERNVDTLVVLDWEGPRPRRLDAGFTERPGRLYRRAIREQFAAIVK